MELPSENIVCGNPDGGSGTGGCGGKLGAGLTSTLPLKTTEPLGCSSSTNAFTTSVTVTLGC